MTPEEIAQNWKLKEEARINGQQRQPEVIKVSVESHEMKQLIESNIEKDAKIKQLETENQSSQAAKELYNDMKEKAALELTNLGVPTEIDDIQDNKDFSRSIDTIKALKAKQTGNSTHYVPAGTVPLSSQTPAKKAGYGSIEEMVDDVRQKPEISQALLSKCLKGVKEGHLILKSYEPPQPETTNSSDLIENGKLSKNPDVLGIQHMHRTKKLRERAAKGDSQAIDLLNSGNY